MPRNVRTARGEVVDFDAIIIKQQLAQAPMNVEVARRRNFIDSKEGKGRAAKTATQVEALPAGDNLGEIAPIVPPTEEAK